MSVVSVFGVLVSVVSCSSVSVSGRGVLVEFKFQELYAQEFKFQDFQENVVLDPLFTSGG